MMETDTTTAAVKFNDATQDTRCEDACSAEIMEAARSTLNAPKWFYKGEDHQIHGPYSSTEMLRWHRAGYFADSMPLRTASEDRFHSLAEWTQYANGHSPFLSLVNTFDQLMNLSMGMHLSQLILTPAFVSPPPNAFVVVPPSSTTQTLSPPATAVSLAPFSSAVPNAANFISPSAAAAAAYRHATAQNPHHPLMLHSGGCAQLATAYQNAANQQLLNNTATFSQPPSEPVDEMPSTTSNTPDDTDCGWIVSNCVRSTGMVSKCVGTEEAPWCDKRDQGSDPVAVITMGRDVAIQTSNRKICVSDAARLLSELFNETVEIEDA